MGQYFKVVNLDKKEYLHPHRFDDGLKLGEFTHSRSGTMAALAMLLADNSDGLKAGVIGRWKGDRIIITGDYSEPEDGFEENLYVRLEEGYKDISREIISSLSTAGWAKVRSE